MKRKYFAVNPLKINSLRLLVDLTKERRSRFLLSAVIDDDDVFRKGEGFERMKRRRVAGESEIFP